MLPSPELCERLLGYFRRPLEHAKRLGFAPESLLDIGAAHGHFTVLCRTIWPDIKVTAVEANKECQVFLRDINGEVYYEMLGAEENVRPFYMTKEDPVSGGNSYYRERTIWFDDQHAIIQNRQVRVLDTLLKDRKFDLMKIDTQGSELDILHGGFSVLANVKVVILEVSLFEYNSGAPLIDSVIRFMQDHSFYIFDIVGPIEGGHFLGDRKNQVDVIFAHRSLGAWLTNL